MSRILSRRAASRVLASHFTRHLRALQFALKAKFGVKATSHSGECAILIGPDKIDMTDKFGVIVARGPAKVATVLVRRRKVGADHRAARLSK